ncbi:MAG: hypothetical protein PSY14_06830 [bacterium]|nr:hypothetical protein [bacterium]
MKSRMPVIYGRTALMLTPYSWVRAGMRCNDNMTFFQRVMAALGRFL